MSKCLLFSLLFFVKLAFSQVNDNFEDGNLMDPDWTASNTEHFLVENGQLRSNCATPNSSFFLSTESTLAVNCSWEFYCNLKFATSGSNYVDVYLSSDQQNLQLPHLNGYFVRIGNTADEISLYKRSGNASVKLIDGADGSVSSTSNNKIKIKVTRSAEGVFTLERDMSGTGSSFLSEGTATDLSYTSSSYFGILIQQSTASFFQKHFFDDISVSPLILDLTPPKLLSAAVVDENTLEVLFDEALEVNSASNVDNYALNNGVGKPINVKAGSDEKRYLLTFATAFNSGNYTLTVENILDKQLNTIQSDNTALFSYSKPYAAKPGDIVINEIFADPNPQIDLPSVEFIELWNTSSESISLQNWKYSDPASTASLPAFTLPPNSYVILCAKADTNEFKRYGKVLGIAPWPSLNNSGDILKLLSKQDVLIDSVAFKDSWYKGAEKKSGGWSLELINPKAVCSGIQNWMASLDPSGGTPGRQNSVYETSSTGSPLSLLSAALKDSLTIELIFSRAVDSLSASLASNYQVNNGLGIPGSVRVISPGFTKAELIYGEPISRGKTYQVNSTNITDCAGTLISAAHSSAEFKYPEKIIQSGILISEVLFNPRPDGVDFVEIYNNSDAELNLQELSIATIKGSDSLVSIKPLSVSPLIFKPQEYLVLSIDPENVKKEYQTLKPDAFLKMTSMPSFNDDAGTVVLLSAGRRIDQFSYTTKMHFPLIKDTEGVSLERSSFTRPSNEPGNFRSAASSVGFATPSYRNSQAVESAATDDEVFLTSKTFSPDNDGFEDALTINYNLKSAGMVANATIYNDRGVLIKRLVRNSTLATEGSITWDGLDEKSARANVGIYILYFDVFDLTGNIKKYRKNFVLAAKL